MEENAMTPRLHIPATIALCAIGALALPALANDPYAVESVGARTRPGATPVIEHRASHRRVEVNAPRPSDDELLRNAVMDRLSSDRMLGGKVGVEAYRHTRRHGVTTAGGRQGREGSRHPHIAPRYV
jgi:hypothetical protein